MARVCYKEINLRGKAMKTVQQAQAIFDDPENAGMTMTLRQLYYQFVQADLIPNNRLSYRKLARVMSDARISGLIDWDLIEDRGRQPLIWATHTDTAESVADALRSFNLDHWKDQKNHVELWVEKDALSAVLRPLAEEFQSALMVNKGYSSTSAVREAAERIIGIDKPTTIIYVGDLDPSGEDMVRDIADRLTMFGVMELEITKVALTMPQIRQYKPPPNPAKVSDPRAREYIREHGRQSWEVDALRPSVLRALIQKAFRALIDMPKFEAWTKKTNEQRADAIRRVGEKREAITVAIRDVNAEQIEVNADDAKTLRRLAAEASDRIDDLNERAGKAAHAAEASERARFKVLHELSAAEEANRKLEATAKLNGTKMALFAKVQTLTKKKAKR